jgi:sialate O-acetylesterase
VAAYPGGNDQFSKEYDAYMKTMDAWRENVKEDKGFQTALAAWRKEDDAAQAEHKPEPPRPPFPSPTPAEPHGRSAGNPSFLFNGMIAPLVPFGLRGVIWFQADGNMGHPQDYGLLIKTLINDWRAQWKRELPFYYIEMNNMDDYPQKDPVQVNKLSLIREQQQAALELPGTGVVCSIDVGLPVPEPHFPNKKPVGDRLALLALNDLYNQKGLVRSPAYKDFRIEGDKVRIHFTDADGLRIIPGHPFAGFAIKGGTGDWVWAQGRIEGNSALVWSDKVPQPVAVRYAWAMNPVISIENGAGLPLRPFRTDTESTQ